MSNHDELERLASARAIMEQMRLRQGETTSSQEGTIQAHKDLVGSQSALKDQVIDQTGKKTVRRRDRLGAHEQLKISRSRGSMSHVDSESLYESGTTEQSDKKIRSHRMASADSYKQSASHNHPTLQILVWSALIALISSWNPLLTNLVSRIQSYTHYVSFAMSKGEIPYRSFFAPDGILYYELIKLEGTLGPVFIIGCEFIALVVSGYFFYRVVDRLGRDSRVSHSAIHWFYMFIWITIFGGANPYIFALPLILAGLYFLVGLTQDQVRDEAALLVGVLAGVTLFIAPFALIFWGVAYFFLFIRNLSKKQYARSIYRLLITFLGFLMVFNPVNYYLLTKETITYAYKQSFLTAFHFDFSLTHCLWGVGIVGLSVVLSGFASNAYRFFRVEKTSQERFYAFISIVMLVISSSGIMLTPVFDRSQLSVMVPFGLLLYVLAKKETSEKNVSYLRDSHYMPVALVLLLVTYPIYHLFFQHSENQARERVAAYIKANSQEKDRIYVWDDRTAIYESANRLSEVSHVTPIPYSPSDATLVYELSDNKAAYIVVNKNVPKTAALEKILTDCYNKQSVVIGNFELYQQKG